MAVGVLVLLGWLIDSAVLKSILVGAATMKANTAICFLLAGLSLFLLVQPRPSARARLFGKLVAATAGAIAVITLVEYGTGQNFGIDELLFSDADASNGRYPGRMAEITGLMLLLLNTALLADGYQRAGLFAQGCAAIALILAGLCCVSYFFSIDALQSIPFFSSVALPTAITGVALAIGLLSVVPDYTLFNLVRSKNSGGVLLRRLLPAVILVPIVVGWLGLAGQRAGWYGEEFQTALFILANSGAMAAFLYWGAAKAAHAEQTLLSAERSLRSNEERYRVLTEALPQMFWMLGPDQRVEFLSKTASDYTGFSLEEINTHGWGALICPDDLGGILATMPAAVKRGEAHESEYRLRHHGGEYRWVISRAIPLKDVAGDVIQWVGSTEDIHERKLAQQQLLKLNDELERQISERTDAWLQSERRFRDAFNAAPIGFALVSTEGRWLSVNRALCELIGYSEEELLRLDFQTITHPDDLDADLLYVRQMLAGVIQNYQMEKRYFHKDGSVLHILLAVSLVRDAADKPLYFVSQIMDITLRKHNEAILQASVHEKEIMMREIHHRVKNNLQIVSTLLDLQSEHATDPQALAMFEESRGRVKSMALIHERLYRGKDMARVNFSEYVRQLTIELYRTYKISDDDIRLKLHINTASLPIDVAIPCGLLLNELMSNCLKHAFVSRTSGSITVSLVMESVNSSKLTVADDGNGFPANKDFRNSKSFGMQLVMMLVAQLKGDIDMVVENGTTFVVRFDWNKTGEG